MWLLVLFCVLVASAEARQDAPRRDAKALLLEIRKKVMITLGQLPRYLCTETIDRSTFQPELSIPDSSCSYLAENRKQADWKINRVISDRLRLDVAVSNTGEMYSWIGENRFENRSLADLVGHGATLTGTFSSFLMAIFGTNAATFTYDGEVPAERRGTIEFGFRVPLENSHYSIGTKLHHATVAYEGTFWADAKNYDLVRLTIRADKLP